jgi:hypothetical protein
MAVVEQAVDSEAESSEARQARALRHAIAQQELEGLKVSSAAIEEMQRAAVGEISEEDVIRNIRARYSTCPDTQTTTPTSTQPREH